MSATDQSKWVWMGHPAHYICAFDCRFHLATYLPNGFIVSTLGEHFPDEGVREIFAKNRGVELEGKGDARQFDYMKKVGFQNIGYGRTYETMVFHAMKSELPDACPACPYVTSSGDELDFKPYNTAAEAAAGHMELCLKWAQE